MAKKSSVRQLRINQELHHLFKSYCSYHKRKMKEVIDEVVINLLINSHLKDQVPQINKETDHG
jgi:hypothetical protein